MAAWGLTFKAATDDLRESPALSVLRRVAERGATLRAFDPTRPDASNGHLAGMDVVLTGDPYDACTGADVLVVLTEWPEFRDLDLAKVASVMATPAIVDTRNMLEPEAARGAGLTYLGMGRS